MTLLRVYHAYSGVIATSKVSYITLRVWYPHFIFHSDIASQLQFVKFFLVHLVDCMLIKSQVNHILYDHIAIVALESTQLHTNLKPCRNVTMQMHVTIGVYAQKLNLFITYSQLQQYQININYDVLPMQLYGLIDIIQELANNIQILLTLDIIYKLITGNNHAEKRLPINDRMIASMVWGHSRPQNSGC